jgi:hypothetical protein
MHRTRTLSLALRTCFILGTCLAVSTCASASKRTTDDAATKKRIAIDIERICALPEPCRSEAITRLRQQTGFELQCAQP